MGLIVQKFGGSSVKDAPHIEHVADIVARTYEKGNDVVVVVSAQGDTTDLLIDKANEIDPNASKREMDVLLSTGEVISIALLSMALQKRGLPAISLTGWQAGFQTNSNHGNARVKKIETDRLLNELQKRNIVIVAGFQGINKYDDLSTLGRGGSDTSAVALAAALKADTCQIYTDVDGIYTTDPRIVKTAKKLEQINYDEMLELTSAGAQVLHNRSVEMAKKYNVVMEVLSSLEDKPGTKVKEVADVEKLLVSGVAKDEKTARIICKGVPDRPGVAFKIFSLLANKKVNVDIIIQSHGTEDKNDIIFTVPEAEADSTVALLKESIDAFGAEDILCDKDVAKVSIVGAGMQSNPGVAATLFEALSEAGINIDMISTSEIKISVLIKQEDADKAIQVIHDAFL